MLSWPGLSHTSIWNSVVRVGISLRAASEHVGIFWLLLQTQVWMMLWVRVCALLNFLNQIPYYGSQCSAFTLDCFEPSRILLFQSVSKHTLGFFWVWGWFVYMSPNSQAPMCLMCWCQASRSSFPKHFCKPVRKSLGVVLRFSLSSYSMKIWMSKLRVWRGSWRAGAGVLPAALAVAELGLPCWSLAGTWRPPLPLARGHTGPELTVLLRGFLPGFLTLNLGVAAVWVTA